MSYYDIYKKRVNRYGLDYQSRVQGQREALFEDYLLKSTCRVDFSFEGEQTPGVLERNKQDETETLQYLLTRITTDILPGTILEISDKDGVLRRWMIYYREEIKASGYNKYIVLKMNHFIEWENEKEDKYHTWAYIEGPGTAAIVARIASGDGKSVYAENNNTYSMIIPFNEDLKKETYIEIANQGYIVKGYDILSTKGVEFVTIDPIYKYDKSPVPIQIPEEDDSEDYFWFKGGNE